MRRHILTFLAASLTMCVAHRAQAALVNGGFESGLSGWTFSAGQVSAVSSLSVEAVEAGQSAFELSRFARLRAGLAENVYTTLSQSFTANVGDVLSGHAFFKSSEEAPGNVTLNDDGFVSLDIPLSSALFVSNAVAVGDLGTTGWTPFTYTFGASGSYTITAGVRNVSDNSIDSFLGLDGLTLTAGVSAVPEPSSCALLGLGGIGWVIRGYRRRRASVA